MGISINTAILTVLVLLSLTAAGCTPRTQTSLDNHQPPRLTAAAAVMRDGAHLPLTRWHPQRRPTAAVVALHGFNDHSGAFEDLGPALAKSGIVVYAYDQRGFGGAPGRGVWPGHVLLTRDLSEVVRLVRDEHPTLPVYALGESMGGAVIMTALTSGSGPDIDGAILSAPAVWGRQTMSRWQSHALDIANAIAPGVRIRPQGISVKPSDNIEMLRALSHDTRFIRETRIDTLFGLVDLMGRALEASRSLRSPLLILYGERDELVPKIPTCLMLKRLPGKDGTGTKNIGEGGRSWRVMLYPNGYHMLFRDLSGQIVTGDIAAWLTEPSSNLPSGHERQPDLANGNPLPGFCPDPG